MSDLLNCSIEIHDSFLNSVESEGTVLKLFVEAYIHKSKGTPGVDPGTVWVQNVILMIENGSFEGYANAFPYDLSDGTLQVDGKCTRNVIPIPLEAKGQVILMLLDKRSGKNMIARGTRISLKLLGEPEYVEQFQ